MAPGARSKFYAAMFQPEIFLKQIQCVKESTCDLVGTFGAQGIVPPLPTLVTPLPGRSFPSQSYQKVLRHFLKSSTWARKYLLQTEVNVARKNLLKINSKKVLCVHTSNTTIEKNITSNCTEWCSHVHFKNWYATCKKGFLRVKKYRLFYYCFCVGL